MTEIFETAPIPSVQEDKPAGHTKGPWKAADKAAWFRGQRHPDDGKIAIQPVGGSGTVANAYGRENARLIAAAPDLLEALIEVREWIRCELPIPTTRATTMLGIVNAAISKALPMVSE